MAAPAAGRGPAGLLRPRGRYTGRISSRRAGGYAKAHAQGRDAAKGGAKAARKLGIAKRSVLWFDLEHFDTGKKECRLSALEFISGWTKGLHRPRDRRRQGRGACKVRVDFPSYRRLERGDRASRVAAAQCLLEQERRYRGRLHGRFDKATARAVRAFQRGQAGVPTSGALTTGTWTSLLSQGSDPVLKYGAGGRSVRRVQRALNAATDARLRIDGVFAKAELRTVKGYQRQSGARDTGVVTGATWRQLRHGRTVGRLLPRLAIGSDLLEGLEELTGIPFSSGASRD